MLTIRFLLCCCGVIWFQMVVSKLFVRSADRAANGGRSENGLHWFANLAMAIRQWAPKVCVNALQSVRTQPTGTDRMRVECRVINQRSEQVSFQTFFIMLSARLYCSLVLQLTSSYRRESSPRRVLTEKSSYWIHILNPHTGSSLGRLVVDSDKYFAILERGTTGVVAFVRSRILSRQAN